MHTEKIYTVYKTINLINGKIYIGVHKTCNPNDNYLGSGNILSKAIKKYGKNNFQKRILFITAHKKQAYKLEKLLVTNNFIRSENNYNIKIGGIGGRGNNHSDDERKKSSERMKLNNPAFNISEETKQKMSDSHKGKPSNAKGKFKVPGDGRFEGCSFKGEENPRAKCYILKDLKNKTHIIKLDENLKIFCQENNLSHKLLYTTKYNINKIICESDVNDIISKFNRKSKNINLYNNTIGWSVELKRLKELDDKPNK